MKKIIRQANLDGAIGVGSRLTGRMASIGATIHKVILVCKDVGGVLLTPAQIINDIDRVVVRVNGDLKIDSTAEFLQKLNLHYNSAKGAVSQNGQIEIPFARNDYDLEEWRSLFAYGTADIDSFQIEVSLKAIAKIASIEHYTQLTDDVRKLGQHIKLLRYPQSYTGAGGVFEVNSLPNKDPQLAYKAVHIEDGASTISNVTVKVGSAEVWKEVSNEMLYNLLKANGKTPMADFFTFDLNDTKNPLSGMLPMAGVADFRQQITFAGAAGNFDIYTEEIHGLNAKAK